MSYKRLIVLAVSILCIVCLSVVSSYASGELTPKRVVIYGALIGETTSTNRAGTVYQVNESVFTVKPSVDMAAVSGFLLFFVLPENVNTFKIRITALNNLTYNADGSFGSDVILYNFNGSSYTDSTYITGSTVKQKSTVDGYATFDWQYIGGSGNRNTIALRIPMGATAVNASSFYNFRVDEFSLNGVAVTDVAVTETNEGFEDVISQLAQNEERMWSQVVAPDLTDFIDRIQSQNNGAYNDYRSVISAVSIDNFLVPGLLLIVFSFAFYSYVIFGRKG